MSPSLAGITILPPPKPDYDPHETFSRTGTWDPGSTHLLWTHTASDYLKGVWFTMRTALSPTAGPGYTDLATLYVTKGAGLSFTGGLGYTSNGGESFPVQFTPLFDWHNVSNFKVIPPACQPIERLRKWDGTNWVPVYANDLASSNIHVLVHGWGPGLREPVALCGSA